jgi:hypothetical protein
MAAASIIFTVFLLFAILILVAFVVWLVLRFQRPAAPRWAPDLRATDRAPVDRAMDAVEEMTPEERERFRRWMDERWPRTPPGGEEGIVRGTAR